MGCLQIGKPRTHRCSPQFWWEQTEGDGEEEGRAQVKLHKPLTYFYLLVPFFSLRQRVGCKKRTGTNFKKYIYIFWYLFLVALGLHRCVWAFSSCGKWGLVSSYGACCRGQALGCIGLVALQHVGSSQIREPNLCLHWQARFLPTEPLGKILEQTSNAVAFYCTFPLLTIFQTAGLLNLRQSAEKVGSNYIPSNSSWPWGQYQWEHLLMGFIVKPYGS